MLKKLSLSTVLLSAILLTGCGGGSKSKTVKEQIQERDLILITHNYPDDVCTSQYLKDELSSKTGARNIIAVVENNTVNCAYYGRDANTCGESVYGGYPNACVVGLDVPNNGIKKFNSKLSDTMLQAL